jgi:hypothetical protein
MLLLLLLLLLAEADASCLFVGRSVCQGRAAKQPINQSINRSIGSAMPNAGWLLRCVCVCVRVGAGGDCPTNE